MNKLETWQDIKLFCNIKCSNVGKMGIEVMLEEELQCRSKFKVQARGGGSATGL